MKHLRLTAEAFDQLQARFGRSGSGERRGAEKSPEARKSPPDQPEGPNGVIRKVRGRVSMVEPAQKLGEGPQKRANRIKTPYSDKWAMELARQIGLVGLPAPELEYRFAKSVGRNFRADLAYPDRMLLLEIDGGAHAIRKRQEETVLRGQVAQSLGYRTITVLPGQVRNGEALSMIEKVLTSQAGSGVVTPAAGAPTNSVATSPLGVTPHQSSALKGSTP